jgi:hypothetical protein
MKAALFALALLLALTSVAAETPAPTCITEEKAALYEERCAANGKSAQRIYERFDDLVCVVDVQCTTTDTGCCFIQDEQNLAVEARCREQGLTTQYKATTDHECKVAIGCEKTDVCARQNEQNTKMEQSCEERGLETLYGNPIEDSCMVAYGCKETTKTEAPVECKKTLRDACVIISCRDGFMYNSCDNICEPEIAHECTTTIDRDGCEVRSCTDGTQTKTCPRVAEETNTADDGTVKTDVRASDKAAEAVEGTPATEKATESRGFFARLFGWA